MKTLRVLKHTCLVLSTILILSGVPAFPAGAQESASKPSVAIVRVWHGGQAENADVLTASFADDLTAALKSNQSISIISRENVTAAIDEVGLVADGRLELDDVIDVGKELQATHVVVGAATVGTQSVRLVARVYAVQNEALVGTAAADGSLGEASKLISAVASDLGRIVSGEKVWAVDSKFTWSHQFKINATTNVERYGHPQLEFCSANPPFELSYFQEMDRLGQYGSKPVAFVLYVDDEPIASIVTEDAAPKVYRTKTIEMGGLEFEFSIELADIKIQRGATIRRGEQPAQWLIDATVRIQVRNPEQ